MPVKATTCQSESRVAEPNSSANGAASSIRPTSVVPSRTARTAGEAPNRGVPSGSAPRAVQTMVSAAVGTTAIVNRPSGPDAPATPRQITAAPVNGASSGATTVPVAVVPGSRVSCTLRITFTVRCWPVFGSMTTIVPPYSPRSRPARLAVAVTVDGATPE